MFIDIYVFIPVRIGAKIAIVGIFFQKKLRGEVNSLPEKIWAITVWSLSPVNGNKNIISVEDFAKHFYFFPGTKRTIEKYPKINQFYLA